MSASPPPRCTFGSRLRIRKHAEFQRALQEGRLATDQRLTVWVRPNGLGCSRLGLMVGRKHGGAVQRNRLKRLIRAAFRLTQHELPQGCDMLCAPRAGAALDLAGCKQSLKRLAARLAPRDRVNHEPP